MNYFPGSEPPTTTDRYNCFFCNQFSDHRIQLEIENRQLLAYPRSRSFSFFFFLRSQTKLCHKLAISSHEELVRARYLYRLLVAAIINLWIKKKVKPPRRYILHAPRQSTADDVEICKSARREPLTHDAVRAFTGRFSLVHDDASWVAFWLLFTAIVCTIDGLFIILRPHTLPGGKWNYLVQPCKYNIYKCLLFVGRSAYLLHMLHFSVALRIPEKI